MASCAEVADRFRRFRDAYIKVLDERYHDPSDEEYYQGYRESYGNWTRTQREHQNASIPAGRALETIVDKMILAIARGGGRDGPGPDWLRYNRAMKPAAKAVGITTSPDLRDFIAQAVECGLVKDHPTIMAEMMREDDRVVCEGCGMGIHSNNPAHPPLCDECAKARGGE
jgi:hypothetical protein